VVEKKGKAVMWIVLGTAGTLALFAYLNRRGIVEAVWDQVTEYRISKLHPIIRDRARAFIAACQQRGIFLRITSGLRTFDEQAEEYAKGRTAPGSIVTNAEPGESYHNYGLAIDVVEMKDGEGLWDNPNWNTIASIGKSFGFRWGGDFNSFKDIPHFEYTAGHNFTQLLSMYKTGNVDESGYVRIAA
jgi:peptidoglycan L-alanyl-D-glutamate endopeptidase CwlK